MVGREVRGIWTVEEVIAALEGRGKRVRAQGKGWMAQCPAHDDQRASLSSRELAHGVERMLADGKNQAEIAKAIRRITEDDALRERLIENAYEDVQRRFSWPAVLQQYRRVLMLEEA